MQVPRGEAHGALGGAEGAAALLVQLTDSLSASQLPSLLQRAPASAVVYGSVCGRLAGAQSVSVSVDGGAPTTAAIKALRSNATGKAAIEAITAATEAIWSIATSTAATKAIVACQRGH